MRRLVRIPILLLVALTLSCNTLSLRLTPTPEPTATPLPTLTPVPPTPTVPPTATATPIPENDLYIIPGDVIVHPEPAIYSGDQVSFEVFAHDGARLGLSNFPVAIYLGAPGAESPIAVESAQPYGLGERLQATFVWAWDTTNLVGPQALTVVLDPEDQIEQGDENNDNNTLSLTVNILPGTALAAAERNAQWATAESDCCIFHYITSTPAERDLDAIKAAADEALRYVEQKLGREQPRKMEFNLINRLLGHGGFAADSITVTYIDRDYSGGGLENVFRHEAAHLINRQFGRDRPALIEEGAATYVAGGHFKEEPFAPRMAGVLALDSYIPLKQLTDDFYNAQHEIGYLEGAAFIDYLVNTYGWKDFATLLGAFRPAEPQSAMLDGGLRLVYSKSLSEMEEEWLAYLRAQPVEERWKDDIELTVAYYDTVRRYQQLDDPSAYFLTAWIPDIQKAVSRGIVADYSRHPNQPANIACETMLIEVDRAIEAADFNVTRRYLSAINAVLDSGGDFGSDPLAADHLALTVAALATGYEPQQIRLNLDTATVIASRPGQAAQLTALTSIRVDGAWRLN